MTNYSELVKNVNIPELVNALRHCVDHDTTCDGCPRSGNNGLCADMLYRDAAAAIEELQAQLPKRGEWELIDGVEPMRWGCSRCKYLSWETSNYCPNCGAKMTEVQE